MTDKIIVELRQTNFFTRWPCTVCGGSTEKVPVLAEGECPEFSDVPANPLAGLFREGAGGGVVRVCEYCLAAGNIDEQLEKTAKRLEARAAGVRGLIGRLQVPTYKTWERACSYANLVDGACADASRLFETARKTWSEAMADPDAPPVYRSIAQWLLTLSRKEVQQLANNPSVLPDDLPEAPTPPPRPAAPRGDPDANPF